MSAVTPALGSLVSSGSPGSAQRLRAVLAAEHAALFAYGRLGVHLDEAHRNEARAAQEAHRASRDMLIVHLDQVKASAVPADAGYLLPFAVNDGPSALRLAAHVEEAVAATWRSALAGTEHEWRRLTVEAYSQAAVRATRWRRIAGVTPLITTFPGRPG